MERIPDCMKNYFMSWNIMHYIWIACFSEIFIDCVNMRILYIESGTAWQQESDWEEMAQNAHILVFSWNLMGYADMPCWDASLFQTECRL